MRPIILLVLVVGPCFAAPTVSNVTFDGIGDSSVRVIFNVSATYTNMRVRYGTSTCTSGSGGSVQINSTVIAGLLYGMTAQLSGMTPSTTYYVCPEVSSDSGATYSSGVAATFTTTARTQTLPTAPTAVSQVYPAQGGASVTVASDCSDLQTKISAASPGDTINVPSGTICTGTYTTPPAPDAKAFTSANLVTSTSTLAITAHGFTENQALHFGNNGNCLPGNAVYPVAGVVLYYDCLRSNGWNQNLTYYAHVVDSGHVQILSSAGGSPAVPGWITFTAATISSTIILTPDWRMPAGFRALNALTATPIQFVTTGTLPGGLSTDTDYFPLTTCPTDSNSVCAFQVALTQGGAAVTITSTGTGTHTLVDRGAAANDGIMYVAPVPTQSGPWIVIKTNGALPPAGVRIDPTWDAHLFQIKKTTYDATPSFIPGALAHNWRIQGVLFNTGTNTDYLTSTDPRSFCHGPSTNPDNRFIVFDRIRIHGASYPNRSGCKPTVGTGGGPSNMVWDGGYISVINSDIRGLDFWKPWYGGLPGATSYDPGFIPEYTPTITLTPTSGGSGASITPVVTSGVITGYNIISGGSGYSTAPTVSFSSAFGSGAAATASVSGGSVTALTITNGGSGYPNRGIQVLTTTGIAKGGVFTTTVTGTTTINFTGGSATGTAYVYFAMDGTLQVLAPSGMAGNCSTTGTTCSFSTTAVPAIPNDGNGRRAGLGIFTITLAGGAVTAAVALDRTVNPGVPSSYEGSNAILAGTGPGPYLISNNRIAGAGLTLHFDDGGALLPRGDYTITGNYFDVSAFANPKDPAWDGLWYGVRQPLEWKAGQRILVNGNTFAGCFGQTNARGLCLVLTPRSGGYTTDVDVTNNTLIGGGINLPSPYDSYIPVSKPAARTRVSNNLILQNAFTHYTPYNMPYYTVPYGRPIQGGAAMEDILISHNTFYEMRAQNPTFSWEGAPTGGVSVNDNIFTYNGDTYNHLTSGSLVSGCTPLSYDKAMFDCGWTPSYSFAGNVLIGSYLDSKAATGFMDLSTMCTNMGGAWSSPNCTGGLAPKIPIGADVPARLVTLGLQNAINGNYRPKVSSPAISGSGFSSDGTGAGVDQDAIADASGVISNQRATAITSSGWTAAFHAPAVSINCYVGYGTSSDPTTWATTSADTTAAQERTIAVTGQTTKTPYYWQVWCAGSAPTVSAIVRTQ